jgi:hypothetical protein
VGNLVAVKLARVKPDAHILEQVLAPWIMVLDVRSQHHFQNFRCSYVTLPIRLAAGDRNNLTTKILSA